ncbi:MAG: hypothetical protein ACXVH4_04035 [Halobacteriota archaeon]
MCVLYPTALCDRWELPGDKPQFRDGFGNTGQLDAENWRHVKFIDLVPATPMSRETSLYGS